ncbi:MAG TPA: protoheme IX farnesyltransferase [Ignavibacteria bacterium]|nr:protoheme IX farnesyltransferase [Ignavibacteria bacterium]
MKHINTNIAITDVKENFVSILLETVKFKITLFVALTTFLGYLLASNTFSFSFIFSVSGIFLLACGSAALNQFQERKYDALMKRTMNRPIPSGKISAANVLMLSSLLILTGSLILFFYTNILSLSIGLLTLVWYNYIYTPLKRISTLAIIPGSIVGALPPLAGWAAAGGDIFNVNIEILFAYFFLWQIPHFWLLLLIYNNDYKNAGFPVLTDKIKNYSLKILISLGAVITAGIPILLIFTGFINYILSSVLIVISGIAMSVYFLKFVNKDLNSKLFLNSFVLINIYNLLIISILSIDKLISFI